MIATGILFKDPTKLYVVAVVDDKNQRDAKLMQNASSELAMAAVKKKGSLKAGSVGKVWNSPAHHMSTSRRGDDSKLL